jgi:hypothetical protein
VTSSSYGSLFVRSEPVARTSARFPPLFLLSIFLRWHTCPHRVFKVKEQKVRLRPRRNLQGSPRRRTRRGDTTASGQSGEDSTALRGWRPISAVLPSRSFVLCSGAKDLPLHQQATCPSTKPNEYRENDPMCQPHMPVENQPETSALLHLAGVPPSPLPPGSKRSPPNGSLSLENGPPFAS